MLWLRWTALAGVAAGTAATLLGGFAPLVPYLELFNQFRPFLVAASLAVLALCALTRRRRLVAAGAALAFANIALMLLPLRLAAPPPTGAVASPGGEISILTFNVWYANPTPERVVDYVRAVDADHVVLQEAFPDLAPRLIEPLRALYPFVTSLPQHNGGVHLLSRVEPTARGFVSGSPQTPPLVWASFSTGSGRPYTVTGIHLAFPFEPQWQEAQTRFLAERLKAAAGPQILVGDFNLAPFTWKMDRLARSTGLLRHATFALTWPAHRFVPVVLLDNLLASPRIRSAGVTIGPDGLGSDHRPMLFRLALEP